MSVRTMSLVFEYDMPALKTSKGETVPDSTAKFVLLALADHANDEGESAYPGIERICKKTSMSRQTVCNAIDALREAHYLSKDGKSKFKTNKYTIDLSILRVYPVESQESSHQTPESPAARLKPSEQPSRITIHTSSAAQPAAPQPKSAVDDSRGNAEFDALPSVTAEDCAKAKSDHQKMLSALSVVCQIDLKLCAEKYVKEASRLRLAGYTPAQVLEYYGVEGEWYRCDWRGQKGQPPDIRAINETIQRAVSGAWKSNGNGNGHGAAKESKLDQLQRVLGVKLDGKSGIDPQNNDGYVDGVPVKVIQ